MISRLYSMLVVAVLIITAVSCMGNFGSSSRSEGLDVATMITAQYRRISPQLAKEMIDSGDPVVIVDVRTRQEYAQGHIAGALLIPNETIVTSERPADLSDPEATILVYCRRGNRSAQAARKLVSLVYVNVYDFVGVIDWPYDLVQP